MAKSKIEKLYSRIMDAKDEVELIKQDLDEIKDKTDKDIYDYGFLLHSANQLDSAIKSLDVSSEHLLLIK